MGVLKITAKHQLDLLWYIFLLGNAFRLLPCSIPANACGTELLYRRVVLANYILVRTSLVSAVLLLVVIAAPRAAAAGDKAFHADQAMGEGIGPNTAKRRRVSLRGMLLVAVRMYVSALKAGIRAAARAATSTGYKAFDADHKATAALVEGLSSITPKWKRVALRGMLLVAVALSAVASVLAIVIFEDMCQYLSGCDGGYSLGSPFSVFMTVATTFVHGIFAWVAVCKN